VRFQESLPFALIQIREAKLQVDGHDPAPVLVKLTGELTAGGTET
jgi:hypothetical protein